MALFAVMPIKNERDRYLEACLTWLRPMVDGVLVYDDCSTDDSADVARSLGAEVIVRSDQAVSFLDHEGMFRQQCWAAFEHVYKPTPGDWVLAIDADEFLVDAEGRHGEGPGAVVGTLRGACALTHATGIVLPIPEVFGMLATGRPLVRTDGYWASIRGPRLFRYQPDGHFNNKPMGCGSEPTYVARGVLSTEHYGLHLMHFGYADAEDRTTKYERYTSLVENGHDNGHIQSIMQSPSLMNWDGMVPDIWRGCK